MFSLPSMPPWDGMHPLVVHFPIALVFVAPLLVILAVVSRKHSATWLCAGALLMIVGAVGAIAAVSTGDAAEDFAGEAASVQSVLHEHEELGEMSRTVVIALAAALSAGAAAWWLWGSRAPRKALIAGAAVYLAAHGAGTLVVVNTAHQGGRLVHEVGVRARLTADASVPNATADPRGSEHDD